MQNIRVLTLGMLVAAGLSIAGSGCSASDSRSTASIPGTGVAMELPDGVTLGPVGTTLTDESGEIIVSIVSGSAEKDLAKSPRTRSMYPSGSEVFHGDNLSGTIFTTTRATVGGPADGLLLDVVKADRALAVQIYYSGSTPGKFEALKKSLATISWDGGSGDDPETAFGMRIDVQGLKLARPGVGALLYTADGTANWDQRNLYVYAVPASLKGNMAKFQQLCEGSAAQMLAGKDHTPIRYEVRDGINLCDTWAAATPTGQEYFAVMVPSDGSVIEATGLGDHDVLQHSLLAFHRVAR